jgi:2-methylcitrate dehydratase PrpD
MSQPGVSARLVRFVQDTWRDGVPPVVVHEANRLLVNQLKASVCAAGHPAITILDRWARASGNDGRATVIWLGTRTGQEQAAMVNAALFEVLDFNETYIPTFQHAVSGVLPAVLALAEPGRQTGRNVLRALALGIEAELACAAILMPTGYYRGFVPGGMTGAIGGAVACGLLMGLDDARLQNAIGLAMNAGLGCYQSAGSMALPFVMGIAARNGLLACQLAAAGMDAPALAFEGDKGMLSAYSDEPAEKIETVLGVIGQEWRILGQSYKTVPTETITHGPIECALALRARAAGREVAHMRFGVSAIVVKIAEERAARFGVPQSDLEARFDLRHCAAAAWLRGRFTLAEMAEPAFTDTAVIALRERIELVADAAHPTFEGASLHLAYSDGSFDEVSIPAFRGTPANPITDDDLSAVFRLSAEGVLPRGRAEAVLDAAWGLPGSADIADLLALLRVA